MNLPKLAILFTIAGAILLGVDMGFSPEGKKGQAALLFNLIFWISICQGVIALTAAGVLAKGKWNQPLKRDIGTAIPMMIFCSIMFLGLIPQWNIYPWHKSYVHTTWFQPNFFWIRNVVVLAVTCFLAWKYLASWKEDKENKETLAVLYLFAFVACQSTIAFEWVMPLAFPWFSTLFGAFYFVSALYGGIAFAGVLAYILNTKTKEEERQAAWKKTHYDLGVFMYGFSVLWSYIFFSQLIVIWYGNFPETVPFLTARFFESPYREISLLTFGCLTIMPFTHMIFRKVKQSHSLSLMMSLVIFTGLFLNQYVIIKPSANISHAALAIEFVLFAIVFTTIIKGHYNSLKVQKA